jgi:hypothetical protein
VDDICARNSRIAQGDETPTDEQLQSRFSQAWEVWAWAQHHRDEEFIQSFSLSSSSVFWRPAAGLN